MLRSTQSTNLFVEIGRHGNGSAGDSVNPVLNEGGENPQYGLLEKVEHIQSTWASRMMGNHHEA